MPSFAELVYAEQRARTEGFRAGHRSGYRSATWESYAPCIAATAEREATEAAAAPPVSRSVARRLAIMETGRLPL